MSTLLEKVIEKISKEEGMDQEPFLTYIAFIQSKKENQSFLKDILKPHKTLTEAHHYCIKKAKEKAKNNRCIMVHDELVYQWIINYFADDTITVQSPFTITKPTTKKTKETNHSNKTPKQIEKETKQTDEKAQNTTEVAQTSIFDFI